MRLLSTCCVGDDDFTIFLRMACILLKILGNLTVQAVLAFSAVLHCFPPVLSDLWWLLALAMQRHQRRQRQCTPLQYSRLGNPMDGGTWWATVHGVVKSQTLSCTGEGNGNPLQCSCLENPRDGSLVGCRLWGRTELDTTDVT